MSHGRCLVFVGYDESLGRTRTLLLVKHFLDLVLCKFSLFGTSFGRSVQDFDLPR